MKNILTEGYVRNNKDQSSECNVVSRKANEMSTEEHLLDNRYMLCGVWLAQMFIV